ncbi:cupin domain-containing protein [Tomitella biformata]|uniref:cupin domain-containing protein n=1 Tax=Tomitella biformata TaxID=630403 RepID=UPI0004662648|nr:cupin domain-containing protein [Tomitella biformata]
MPDASSILIANGLPALAEQNPILEGKVSPHFTYDGTGFRIRHLAFDAGAVLAEHKAPLPIIVQVVEGSVEFTVDGQTHTMGTGAILYVAAENPHAVAALERARLIVTLVG